MIDNLHVLQVPPDSEHIKSIKFLVYRQKYLELLEQKNTREALQVLRTELAPVTRDVEQLHKLTALVMCQDVKDLYKRAKWDGANGESRQELLDDLHKYISPSLMVPKDRLQKLLLQAVNKSNDGKPISLLQEEIPPTKLVPRECIHVFEDHTDEVWYVTFSPNGKYMATSGADRTLIIYDIENYKKAKPLVCKGHTDAVSVVAFSPDSTMILSGSNDKKIKLWDVATGECKKTFSKHKDIVVAVSWLPDNKHFISGGGGNDRTIRRWDISTGEQVELWKMNYRIHDLAVTPDGTRLVVVGAHKKIIVYFPLNRNQNFTLLESEYITSLSLSPCSRYALCNISRDESFGGKGGVHLWDLEERRLIREFSGHSQTKFVVRSSFGGKNNCFVASGSEDCKVYIWEKNNSRLIDTLSGHVSSVNCVAWNPKDPFMFASASDDNSVRLWGHVDKVKEI